MALTQHTAPTVWPFEQAADYAQFARRYLKEYDETQDDLIQTFIKVATMKTQSELRRSLYTQKWRLTLDAFPASRVVPLEYPPITGIDSVKYYDSSNTQVTLSSTKYTLNQYSSPGLLYLNYGETWPSTYTRPNAVEIIFSAGYGTTDETIPHDILQAIKFLVAHIYLNREPTSSAQGEVKDVPMTYEWLIAPHRVYL